MRIKIKGIIFLFAAICVAIECKWGDILGIGNATLNPLKQFLYIIMFIYCRLIDKNAATHKIYRNKIDSFMILLGILMGIEVIHTASVNGVSMASVFRDVVRIYSKYLFVYPLVYLLQKYSFKSISTRFLTIAGLSMTYQAVVSLIFNLFGKTINEIILPVGSHWMRNGLIRINSTSIFWLIPIIALMKYRFDKKNRMLNLIFGISTVLFMVLVNQSRSLYISVILSLLACFVFSENRTKKQMFQFMAVFVVLIAFTQSSIFNTLVSSFQAGSVDDTLTYRIRTLVSIKERVMLHPILGTGIVGESIDLAGNPFYFIDFGIIGDYMQLGVVALFQLLGILVCIRYSIKKCIAKNSGYMLSIGILVFVIFGLTGFTIISNSRNFVVPCIMGFLYFSAENSGMLLEE